MKLIFTANEILDKGCWDDFCESRGYSVWCINEGQMSSDEEFTFTEDEAKTIGLISVQT